MERIEVYLTPAQHKKLMMQQPFQLSAQQLKAADKKVGKKFHVELHMPKHHHTKLMRNVRADKGFRFNKDNIAGGDLLGEMWNGVKSAASAVAQYVPADLIRQGVKTGLTAAATAAGTLVGNPELGLMAAPLISKGVDYAEKGYNYFKDKKPTMETAREEFEKYRPQMQQYVEDRVPAARRARQMYDEYAPRARKVYQKARKVYYQEPDDEDEEDDEDEYEPPPPPRRRRKAAPRPSYSAPASSDYSGYSGRGIKLKKGSAEAKAWGAKMRAMRKIKGGEIEDGKYFQSRTLTPEEQQAWYNSPSNPYKAMDDKYKAVPLEVGKGYTKAQQERDAAYAAAGNGAGLKKGSAAAKAWGAKMKAMRKVRGGQIVNIPSQHIHYEIPDSIPLNEIPRYVRHSPFPLTPIAGLTGNAVCSVDPSTKGDQARQKQDGWGLKKRGRKIKGGWNPFNADDWDPNKNGVGDVLDPNKNGLASGVTNLVNQIGDSLRGAADNVVTFYQQAASSASSAVNESIAEIAKSLPSDADATALGNEIVKQLIKRGIPQATAILCGTACEALFPEGGPVSYQLGSELGKQLGDKLADITSEKTGYGIHNHRGHRVMVKGGTLRHGVPHPHYTKESLARISTHGLDFRHKGANGLYTGGSFASP